MWSYDTNYMGPINKDWLDKNPGCWAGGRIDCYYSGEDPVEVEKCDWNHKTEMGVPVMDCVSWGMLTNFLETVKSDTLLSYAELASMFKEFCNYDITYHHETDLEYFGIIS